MTLLQEKKSNLSYFPFTHNSGRKCNTAPLHQQSHGRGGTDRFLDICRKHHYDLVSVESLFVFLTLQITMYKYTVLFQVLLEGSLYTGKFQMGTAVFVEKVDWPD